jgi:hypothetical protein
MKKLASNVKDVSMSTLHPALDFVNGVAYVAVKVAYEGEETGTAIITSEGEAWDMDEHGVEVRKRGLVSHVKEINLQDARWKQKSIMAYIDGDRTAPNWEEAYKAIYTAYDERLVVRDKRYLTIMTLFSMMTYFHPLYDVLPIIHMLGPSESGKSRLGTAIAKVAFNGKEAGDITRSSLFREANEGQYTQVLKECDNLAHQESGDSFARQLQAGTTKSEATIILSEATNNGKSYKPETFYTFVPRVLISTKQFRSQPLRSRTIRLDITRTPNADDEKLRRAMDDDIAKEVWSDCRDNMYRLLLLNWKDVVDEREKLKREWKGPKGRAYDKFLPLATIASLVGPSVLATVTELAMEGQAEMRQDESRSFEGAIHRFMRQLVKKGDRRLTTKELYAEFVGVEDVSLINDRDVQMQTPEWAKKEGMTVTIEQLHKWVWDADGLEFELKRLGLIPQKKDDKLLRGRKVYSISKANADALVSGYIGDQEEEALPNEDTPPEDEKSNVSSFPWGRTA